jgi:hypothetical protein
MCGLPERAMKSFAIKFVFDPDASLAEAEMSLHLAMFAVEGLIGRVRVRLDAKYHVNEVGHSIIIDTGSAAGRLIVRVFTALLLREIGEQAFRIHRLIDHPIPQTVET